MLFCAGTQEVSGTNKYFGTYNLTPAGETMFLNAVAYMIPEPTTIVLLGLGSLVLRRYRRS
jgi:hypothetical protein